MLIKDNQTLRSNTIFFNKKMNNSENCLDEVLEKTDEDYKFQENSMSEKRKNRLEINKRKRCMWSDE